MVGRLFEDDNARCVSSALYNSMSYLVKLPGWLRNSLINGYGCYLKKRRFGRKFHEWLAFLQDSQSWSDERRVEYQVDQLKHLLSDAENNVPFYGKHFAECEFRASQFSCLEDLERIEPVSKGMLLDSKVSCIHRNVRNMNTVRCLTSGTTGQKFEFHLPFELRYPLKFATIWRQYSWAGVQLFDRRVTLGGRLFAEKPPFYCFNRAENQLLLSIHHLSPDVLDSYFETIEHYQPAFMQGHPSGIAALAHHLKERGLYYQLKGVFSTGETLFPADRVVIEEVFKCSVFEEYGSGECAFAAQQAPDSDGFHEVSELGFIEFLATASPTHSTIAATSLHNNVMPFIRYHVEDLVEVAETSDSGNPNLRLPVKIKSVLGRIDEKLFSADGSPVLPVTIRMCIKPFLPLGALYQVRQEGALEVAILFEEAVENARFEQIKQRLQGILGTSMNIRPLLVERIQTGGGKLRNVINRWKQG